MKLTLISLLVFLSQAAQAVNTCGADLSGTYLFEEECEDSNYSGGANHMLFPVNYAGNIEQSAYLRSSIALGESLTITHSSCTELQIEYTAHDQPAFANFKDGYRLARVSTEGPKIKVSGKNGSGSAVNYKFELTLEKHSSDQIRLQYNSTRSSIFEFGNKTKNTCVLRKLD